MAPTGMSAEPMRVHWTHDTAQKFINHAIVRALARLVSNFNSYTTVHECVSPCIAVLTTNTKASCTEFSSTTRRVHVFANWQRKVFVLLATSSLPSKYM